MKLVIRDKETVKNGGKYKWTFYDVVYHGETTSSMYIVVSVEQITAETSIARIPMVDIDSVWEYADE